MPVSTDGFGNGLEHAVARPIVLHEHEIPDLDVAVAVLVGRSRRTAWDLRAVIVENLAARTAGAGVAHLPEIGASRPSRVQRVGSMPISSVQIRSAASSSLNTVTHSRSFGMPSVTGNEIPREMDRFALEVVAEAEIAEHLEKRVMPRGVADVLEIVVLAAGAHAALRTRGARCSRGPPCRGTRP